MRLVRLVTVATFGVVLLLFASGCGSTTAGDPSPSAGDSAQRGSPPSASGAELVSPKAAVRMLKETDPCNLLDRDDRAELDITSPGKTDNYRKIRGCHWEFDQGEILITIGAHHGLDSFKLSEQQGGGKLSSLTINGRAAKQQRSAHGGCDLALRVTDTSRVDIQVALEDESQSCAGAQQVARLVEPHLPSVK